MSSPGDQLAQGIAELRLPVTDSDQRKLLQYLALIEKWNRVYNLTAVRSVTEMVSRHLLDCLAITPYVSARFGLDVGSGAGLPGIPLAVIWPQAQITLLDSNHKKTVFLQQAAVELELTNTTVVCERAENWQSEQKFDLVISRAFSGLSDFIGAAGRLCAPDGVVAAMKGVYPHEEVAQLPPEFSLKQVTSLAVPGLSEARHLVLLQLAR